MTEYRTSYTQLTKEPHIFLETRVEVLSEQATLRIVLAQSYYDELERNSFTLDERIIPQKDIGEVAIALGLNYDIESWREAYILLGDLLKGDYVVMDYEELMKNR